MSKKITQKQAEKAVRKNLFRIKAGSIYSKDEEKKAKSFKEKHGFRYEDAWNLDKSVACFVLPRLVYLRDNSHGYPGSLQLQYETEDEAVAAWEKTLNEMIEGFYLYVTKDSIYWTDEDKKAWFRAKSWFCKYFENLWD